MEDLTPILNRWFQKIQTYGRLPNSFYEASIILIPKPDKNITKKENLRTISLMNIECIILKKISAKDIQQFIKNITHHDKVGVISGMQGRYNIHKSIHAIYLTNKMKDNNLMIISIDAEKAFDKVQRPFMIKNTQQNGNKGRIPQHHKGHICETYSQHHTQWTKTKKFPTKLNNKTRISTIMTSIQNSVGSPSHSNQTRKRNKKHQIEKEEAKLSLFAGDIIVYIEKPIDSTKKLLALINEFGKKAGYKGNTKYRRHFCTLKMKCQKQKSGK